MSTIDRSPLIPSAPPPLTPGQRLDQESFHARYQAMAPDTRAELIGGIVYMPSPLGSDHGDRNVPTAYWLGHYQRSTPGVRGTINSSTILDETSEVQPDCSLRILPEFGGRTRIDPRYA